MALSIKFNFYSSIWLSEATSSVTCQIFILAGYIVYPIWLLKMFAHFKKILFFAFLCYLCSACLNLETICADTIEPPVAVNFKQKIRIRRLARPDSIIFRDTFLFVNQIQEKLTNKLIYNFIPTFEEPEDSLSIYGFPFNPLSDSVRYVLSYRRGKIDEQDTLSFSYNRKIELSSPECGLRTNYSNFLITRHTFDSIVLRTNPQNNVSLDIYYFAQ